MEETAENKLRAYSFTDDEILEIVVSERLIDTAKQMSSDIWIRNNYIHVSTLDCAFLIKQLKQELA